MFNINKEEITWNNTPLVIETGHIARQSDGAVMITYGETTILCTAVFSKDNNPNVDFLPLSVDYQEKYYASGRIPGGFFKREGRPTEKEIIISRLIDRPLRPLFPEGFQHETQILATVLSYDNTNLTDIPSIIGCSAALCISGIPVEPIGAARIGYKNEKYILNPSKEELKSSQLDLIIVGTKESILMVETEAHELPEKIILEAIKFGHEQIQPIVDIIAQLSTKVNISQHDFANRNIGNDYSIQKILIENYKEQISELYNIKQKKDRELKLTTLRNKAIEDCSEHIDNVLVTDNIVLKLLKKLEKKIIRDQIIRTSTRIDGRNEDTIRPIESKINILKRTHGSALFTRGETQSLAVTTLGTGHDEQIVDAIGGEYRERFMLHYNFPGYAVGEIGRNMSPKRREIGHGKLAWKALNQVLPKSKEFPYTIRVVSEITESNGSSSMATVCSSSLSLMSAGVPLS
jgi:polyribonucleotide nucleotidyltransferase